MNVDVATDNSTLVGRNNLVHMAESAIHVASKDEVQNSSLWRPVTYRKQMTPVAEAKHAVSVNNALRNLAAAENSTATVTANSKSIPVHCIVVSTTTPSYAAGFNGSDSTDADVVDIDSFAIIAAATPFTHIVPTVMRKLGYSDDVIFTATGWLEMKHWRPLSLNQIASSDADTVGDILGELTTVATLRIFIRRNMDSANYELKEKLLRWLLSQSHRTLTASRCPVDEKWQQQIIRGERASTPPADVRRQFDHWFQQEFRLHQQQQQQQQTQQQQQQQQQQSLSLVCRSDRVSSPVNDSATLERELSLNTTPPRVRMRTTFDPEFELPRLQRWFAENQHPTRYQLQLYVQDLNALESRRGRKPLDISNLVYWFKNARAAYKRTEMRTTSNNNNTDTDWSVHASESVNPPTDDEALNDDASSASDHSLPPRGTEAILKTEPEELTQEPDPEDLSGSESESEAENLSMNNNKNLAETENSEKGDADPMASTSMTGSHFLDRYPGFPLSLGHAQNMLNPHLVYVTSPYIQGLGSSMMAGTQNRGLDPLSLSDDRRKRNRTFIDPVTEVPRLEHWFSLNTHPSHSLILRYTDELNRQPYRQKFPKLEPKNVQFWFKNRRAKCKRLKISI